LAAHACGKAAWHLRLLDAMTSVLPNARASELRARHEQQAEEKEEAAYSNEGNAVRAADGFHTLQCSSRSDPSSPEKLF
jgi:hypothetical protein